MFGGGVAGGKILGRYPRAFHVHSHENIGRGRLIPTRSWDALWYGSKFCSLFFQLLLLFIEDVLIIPYPYKSLNGMESQLKQM